ncbi:MAG: ATP-binding protein [Candidatus Magnetominusculus sp. LBB02]|nr:ATP-binding protein [Candidatus Magnetominusculus sp. LBB02]
MKIRVKNLGIMRQAEFELGDLTIICGENNTGKTYLAYALYGFLKTWNTNINMVSDQVMNTLMENGSAELNIDELIKKIPEIVKNGCNKYQTALAGIFASSESRFSQSTFMIDVEHKDIQIPRSFKSTLGSANNQQFEIIREIDSSIIRISLLVDKGNIDMHSDIISRFISRIILQYFLPKAFIVSTERTGAAIFQNELDIARNRLLDEFSKMKKETFNPIRLFEDILTGYALPVKENIDFIRSLSTIKTKDSFIIKEHEELLSDFNNIVGGSYSIDDADEPFFTPKSNNKLKLTMGEASSSVRSLLILEYYLKHIAEPGDLLMIDEPEINLHPKNQRLIARLLARLVNIGIKVFITTHSDYIVKEFNSLIMMNQDKPYIKRLMEKYSYKQEELLSTQKVRAYIADRSLIKAEDNKRKTRDFTLINANIDDESGIEVKSFDNDINEMNEIQDAIQFGEVDD